MTTATMSSVVNSLTTAGFRLWIADFHALITAAGLVQTADTGQIDLGTVTLINNAISGFSTWRNADSSMYFKFSFGHGSTAGTDNLPRIDVSVGEGTNGSGTLTGAATSAFNITASSNANSEIASQTIAYPSFCCATNDFFGVVWVANSQESASDAPNTLYGHVVICKTVDNTGAATNLGWFQMTWKQIGGTSGTVPVCQCVRRTAPVTVGPTQNSFSIVPGLAASQPATPFDASGALQCYVHVGHFPHAVPVIGSLTAKHGPVPTYGAFQATLVGSTPHTYLWLGFGQGATSTDGTTSQINNTLRHAMLWE